MTQPKTASSSRDWVWALVFLALVAWRLPSIARPAGGDQHLYAYTAERLRAGDVPYRDAWDQKPPGVFVAYAGALAFWPDVHVIAVLDVLVSVATALLLIGIGRRLFGGRVGELSGVIYLLLSDPGIQKMGGMYLRSQCETFVAAAVTAAIALSWREKPALFRAGVFMAAAFWLKYNALVFALPIGLAGVLGLEGVLIDWRRVRNVSIWLASGFALVAAIMLIYFASAGALTDLWLATITYNIRYAGETYSSLFDALAYVFGMPIARARVDGLWFVGLLGLGLLVWFRRSAPRATIVTAAWVVAAVLSIAVNGSRGLPQYFIQATPALALAAAAGLVVAWRERDRAKAGKAIVAVVAILLAAGIWRVGIEGPLTQPRLFGLPQAVRNNIDDIAYLRGEVLTETYLLRFDRGEGGKFSLLPIERLAARVNELATPTDRAFVFGFAGGGVLVKARRQSASRFFWSRPVVLEFEGGRPGYGSAGLLADLTRNAPAVVALQKHDWGLAEATTPDSIQFFMNQPQLRAWLEAGYTLDYEDAAFAVWRRKT